MIYLNHSATSWPKPECVVRAYREALEAVPESQYRSSGAVPETDTMDSCRKVLGSLLGIADTGRIFFSSGATESANLLAGGLLARTGAGGNILVTAAEHNAVLRTVYNQPEFRGRVKVIPCDGSGRVTPEALRKTAGQEPVCAVFINHCSNVTGAVQPVRELTEAAHALGALAVLDLSQSAGCVPVSVDGTGEDAVFFTGHKALLGVPGTGGYYVRRDVPFVPVKFGGTGRNSARLDYSEPPYEFEPGTQNLPGIAALKAGAEFVLKEGVSEISRRETGLVRRMIGEMRRMDGVRVYDAGENAETGPLFSFTVDGLEPRDVAYILNSSGIIVRVGLHCAPLIHEYIGSGNLGTVRVSVGYCTTERETDEFLDVMRGIAASRR